MDSQTLPVTFPSAINDGQSILIFICPCAPQPSCIIMSVLYVLLAQASPSVLYSVPGIFPTQFSYLFCSYFTSIQRANSIHTRRQSRKHFFQRPYLFFLPLKNKISCNIGLCSSYLKFSPILYSNLQSGSVLTILSKPNLCITKNIYCSSGHGNRT